MVTRRALLGAGALALVAGCGPPDAPEIVPADVLNEQLGAQQTLAASVTGPLAVRARARVALLEEAVRRAGGTPVRTPASGTEPIAAAGAALSAHVAAVGQLGEREWRDLLATLVAGTAADESALLAGASRPAVRGAFPGQATA